MKYFSASLRAEKIFHAAFVVVAKKKWYNQSPVAVVDNILPKRNSIMSDWCHKRISAHTT